LIFESGDDGANALRLPVSALYPFTVRTANPKRFFRIMFSFSSRKGNF
jgi:hypothetical protein